MKKIMSFLTLILSFSLTGCFDFTKQIKDPVYYAVNTDLNYEDRLYYYEYTTLTEKDDKNSEVVFKQICSENKCSSFNTQSFGNTENIKAISIIPVYNSYSSYNSDNALIFIAKDKKFEKDERFKDFIRDQSFVLIKVEFKDDPKPVIFRMRYSLNTPYGMKINFDNNKSIIYSKKPEVFQVNYSNLNDFVSTIIVNSIEIKSKIDKINNAQKQNTLKWEENEIK